MSCIKPNNQQIPRDEGFRRCVEAPVKLCYSNQVFLKPMSVDPINFFLITWVSFWVYIIFQLF